MSGGLQGTFEAQFKFDSEGNITECPAGNSPIDAWRGKDSSQAHFDTETCQNCPYCDRCPGVFQKKAALIVIKDTALKKAEFAQKQDTEEYWTLAKKRNGVEGVPSILRRRYGIDHMRDKGLVRKRQRLGIKLMAVNAVRLTKWRKSRGKSASAVLCFLFVSFFNLIFRKSAQLSIS